MYELFVLNSETKNQECVKPIIIGLDSGSICVWADYNRKYCLDNKVLFD